jgi:HEPN domain-containing protein
MSEYLENAKEFTRMALKSKLSAVTIQNAHKAVEFALCGYAEKIGYRIPRDHWETKNLAYRINKKMGKDFSSLLSMYLGAYRLKNGDRMEEAINLMKKMLEELGKLVGESILPNE